MGLVESQNQILALLRALPNLTVHDDEVADEVTVDIVPGSDQIRPFLTVSFGGAVEVPLRLNGIAGAAKDSAESTIVIQAVASTAGGARNTMQRARDVLLGFKPTNCGEIRNALFGGTGKLSHLGNPTRYASNQSFRFYQNAE